MRSHAWNRCARTPAIAALIATAALSITLGFPLPAQDKRIAPLGEGAKRFALVLGNAAYINLERLGNSANDAHDMAAALHDAGFTVIERENASRETMDAAVDEFIRALRPGDVALFYYSGHGMQINGDNYLAAIDLSAQNEVQARNRSLKASEVLEQMEASGAALNIVVLDACRDNPFGATRSIGGQGLAPMNAGKGTLLAYATAPGHTADDNRQARNGLYTSYLLQALREPGLSLEQMFKRAGGMVQQASGGRQVPWISSSVNGDFYFRGGVVSSSPISSSRPPDLDAWEAARDSGSAEALQVFLTEFPQSQYAAAARVKLATIKRPAESASHSPDVPAPDSPSLKSMRIGQIDISHFAGLTPSDTRDKVIALLGKPNKSGPHYLVYASHTMAILTGDSSRVSQVEVNDIGGGQGMNLIKKLSPDPLLSLLGKQQADVTSVLGKPSQTAASGGGSETWTWFLPDASSGPRVDVMFISGKCRMVRVQW